MAPPCPAPSPHFIPKNPGSIKLARVRRPPPRARGAFWWRFDFCERTLAVVAGAGGGGGGGGGCNGGCGSSCHGGGGGGGGDA